MTHFSLNSYLQQVEDSINCKDGRAVGRLLAFTDPHVASPRLQVESPESQCERWFEQPWDEIVAAHLRCCYSVANRNFVEAYGYQALGAQALVKVLQTYKEENWMLPIMFVICVDLRNFAGAADAQQSRKSRTKSGENSEKAAEILMSMFRVCASDNRAAMEDSKKWGMLNLVNQLFKIYFKINKLQLCKPLIRAIDSLPFKDKFAVSQLITYRYYVGRKELFDSDFKSAEEYLTYAFQHCHIRSKRNKRLILIYLIPVKMLLGHMPSTELLRKYDLTQFADVTSAVSCGNLMKFNEALNTHQAFFIRCGIYLILEKLKIITYRNLFKKVSLLLGSHQLPISAFTAVLRFMGEEDVDDDEVECILANLIYEKNIKGYISRAHRKLVISKKDAFPPLATVL